MLTVLISNEHKGPLAEQRVRQAVRAVCSDAGIRAGEISVAVVSNKEMHELNQRFLSHDYPTDVLSFLLEHDTTEGRIEGEIILGGDYAAGEASRYGWKTEDELLLYAIHGALHLVGYDDTTPVAKAEMRQAERRYLATFELIPRYDES